jgi:hypothetical protein
MGKERMTTFSYRVHGGATVPRPVKVQFNGAEIDAVTEGYEVVLVPTDDPTLGTVTWQFVGAEAVKARAEFKDGAVGTITWTPSAAVSGDDVG